MQSWIPLICDNQLDELDSQVSVSCALSDIEEVDEAINQSILPPIVRVIDSSHDVTDNLNVTGNKMRLTNANVVVSDKTVTDNVECSTGDPDRSLVKEALKKYWQRHKQKEYCYP